MGGVLPAGRVRYHPPACQRDEEMGDKAAVGTGRARHAIPVPEMGAYYPAKRGMTLLAKRSNDVRI